MSDAVNNTAGPSSEYANPQTIEELTEFINTVLNRSFNPVFDTQQTINKKQLIKKQSKYLTRKMNIDILIKEISDMVENVYKTLYKFDGQQTFVFDEEISIVDKCFQEITFLDNVNGENVAFMSAKKLPDLQINLPAKGIHERKSLNVGKKVYCMKYSLMKPWFEGTITIVETLSKYTVLYEDGKFHRLSLNNLAYFNRSSFLYLIGSRVIAKIQDINLKLTDKFYAGVVGERPTDVNGHRYLIFFDNGYAKYVNHKDIRLVCRQSQNVSHDVHKNISTFINTYLEMFPERPMVKFIKNQVVRTKLHDQWYLARMVRLDASLFQLRFLFMKNEHMEWIYRGSNRLEPINNQIYNKLKPITVNKDFYVPYIKPIDLTENEQSMYSDDTTLKDSSKVTSVDLTRKAQKHQGNNGVVKISKIPAHFPKPKPYKYHKCCHKCMSWVQFDHNKTNDINVLRIPLEYGFTRRVISNKKQKTRKVIYTTPCGCKINNEDEMCNYLELTGINGTQMTIDLFNFDISVNPLSVLSVPDEFILIPDMSYGMELKKISVVNHLNDLLPPHMEYITKRKPTLGVNLNLDRQYLCGCDCTDNCQDKTKCSCWKLTNEAPKNYPLHFQELSIGYSHKRLHKQLLTGIYECNDNCKCMQSCLNRVVQKPMKTSLQMFFTENKGWGVRTLADIPKGCFICTFVGEVCTNDYIESNSIINGDTYLADLDFIITAEEIKDGYESLVVQLENKYDSDLKENSSSDEDYNPGWAVKNNNRMPESRTSLRKDLQKKNTTTAGMHELSKLDTHQNIVASKSKSLLSYLDKDVLTIDAKVRGNIGRYFNHSCDPNMFIQNVFVDTHDLRLPWVAYFALSNIPAGTELTFDYGYVVGSVKNKTLKCQCGAKNCKGRLL